MTAYVCYIPDGESGPPTAKGILALRPPGCSKLDFLVWLLHEAAEVEHSLMVQYLYAAFSIDMSAPVTRNKNEIYYCRNTILTIAKEEMGHLMTVQNLLRLVREPVFLRRDSFRSPAKFFGFPFRLEPLSLDSLSCYIAAERPKDSWPQPVQQRWEHWWKCFLSERKAIEEAVEKRTGGQEPERVGALYEAIIELLGDADVPDSAFDSHSYSRQASWDEWGKELDVDVVSLNEKKEPSNVLARVFVKQMSSRTQAINALEQLTDQGEAARPSSGSEEPSHFVRFMEIYQKFREAPIPVRRVPTNPTTKASNGEHTLISNPVSRTWADLFNLRYVMLLTYLAHAFEVLGNADCQRPGLRAGLLHRTFGEMYNLRTIAEILVRMPLADPPGPPMAGPPFALPADFQPPATEPAFWSEHRRLLAEAQELANKARVGGPSDGVRYLDALCRLDAFSCEWVDKAAESAS
jgi:ferritin-like protein